MFRLIKITALGIAVYFAAQAYSSYQVELQSKSNEPLATDGLFDSIAPAQPRFGDHSSSLIPARPLFPDRETRSLGDGKLLKTFSDKRPRPLQRLLGKD